MAKKRQTKKRPTRKRQTGIAGQVFAGDSATAKLMRALDWSRTPLGPVEQWPQSLKTCIGICLNSRFAIRICWGPKLAMLYNDAYIPIAGGKHPKALGGQPQEIWAEVWDIIGPMLMSVMETGEATWADDLLLPMERHGYREECYFTFSYSPIRDELGGIGGVFTPVLETTERVFGERRLRTLKRLGAIGARLNRNAACAAVAEVLAGNPYDLPFAAIYLFEDTEKCRATLAASTVRSAETPFPKTVNLKDRDWPSLGELKSSEIRVFDATAMPLTPLPLEPWGAAPVQAVAVAIAGDETGGPVGFLLAGVNLRKRLDAAYRDFYSQIAREIGGTLREAEARERERSLRAGVEAERQRIVDLFMLAPAPIAILEGPQHRFRLMNRKYLEFAGRESAEAMLGKPAAEEFPELASQGFTKILDMVYRTGERFIGSEMPFEWLLKSTAHAEQVYLNFVYEPIRNEAGAVEGIFVLIVDVTEQVLARRGIESREEQFRALANSIPQLAWMADAGGYIFWYNRRWYEYTGTSLEEMRGWGWASVHDPARLPKIVERWKHALDSGEDWEDTFPLRGRDGVYRMFLSRAQPVRDSAGKIVRWFGTNTDVDAQQKTEMALRQAEKLAAVGRLASSIAHEINNPLEAVTNLIYLARVAAVNEDAKAYLNSAEQELQRVSQITNQTLRFHKQQSAPSATDVAEIMDSILTLYRGRLTRDGIQLQVENRECPPIVCYAGEIRQVLANLVGNALDAMPKGGTLHLRMRPVTDWRGEKPGIRITVADTGDGMPEEVRKRIYEPFFTTKGEIGTGLGLWVSAGIVDKHRGSIHVRSSTQPGASWTVFTVILPLDGTAATDGMEPIQMDEPTSIS